MTFRLSLIVFSAVLTAACTSTIQKVDKVNLVINKEVCCQTFNQFSYTQLLDKETLEFSIDEQSQVAEFNGSKSYFSALELPARAEKVSISIDSLMLKKEVFAPTLLLLNNKYKIVEKIELSQFEKKTSSMFTGTSFSKKLEIKKGETPYLIIYTSQNDLGKKTEVRHPAIVRAEKFGEPWPMVTNPVYLHSLTGTIKLTIETNSLQTAKQAQQPIQAAGNTEMLSETELFYNQQITKAITDNNIKKAIQLVEEAEKAGSKTAKKLFIELLEK